METSGLKSQHKAKIALLPKDIKRIILAGPGQCASPSKEGTTRRRAAQTQATDSSPHHAHTDPMANAPKRRRLSRLPDNALDIACPLHAVVRFNKGKSKAFMNGAASWIKISAPETPATDPEGSRTHLQDIRRYMSGRSHPPTRILRSVLQKILASCTPSIRASAAQSGAVDGNAPLCVLPAPPPRSPLCVRARGLASFVWLLPKKKATATDDGVLEDAALLLMEALAVHVPDAHKPRSPPAWCPSPEGADDKELCKAGWDRLFDLLGGMLGVEENEGAADEGASPLQTEACQRAADYILTCLDSDAATHGYTACPLVRISLVHHQSGGPSQRQMETLVQTLEKALRAGHQQCTDMIQRLLGYILIDERASSSDKMLETFAQLVAAMFEYNGLLPDVKRCLLHSMVNHELRLRVVERILTLKKKFRKDLAQADLERKELSQEKVTNFYMKLCPAESQVSRAPNKTPNQSVPAISPGRGGVEKKNPVGETKLHQAAKKGNYDKVKEMLSLGADPNTKCNGNYTALFDAVMKGHTRVIQLLLESGADADDGGGNTHSFAPLHEAVCYDDDDVAKDMCRLLLAEGADTRSVDKDGLTPYEIAIREHPAIAAWLKEEQSKQGHAGGPAKLKLDKKYSNLQCSVPKCEEYLMVLSCLLQSGIAIGCISPITHGNAKDLRGHVQQLSQQTDGTGCNFMLDLLEMTMTDALPMA